MFVNRKVPIYQIRLEYINWYAREWLFVLIYIYSFHHFELLKHVFDTRSRRSEWCRFWSDQSKMARFQPCNIINKRGTMGSMGHIEFDYERLWYNYVYFNSASSGIQWVVSLLQWLTKLGVLNVSHYATMKYKTSVKHNWRCFKSWSVKGRIESVRVQSD